MSRELWEIVRADELRAGDALVIAEADELCRYVALRIDRSKLGIYVAVDKTEHRDEENLGFLYDETVLRRIHDADDPRVLRRALQMAIFRIFELDRHSVAIASPNYYIDQARHEMESERTDDQA